MNPHDIAATRSLVLLVCQFRHFRIHYENEMSFTRLFNNSKCFPNCQCSFAHFLKKIVEIIFVFLLTSYRKTDTIIFVSFELSHAGVAELADAQASGACGSNRVGSSPISCIKPCRYEYLQGIFDVIRKYKIKFFVSVSISI